MNIEVRFSYYYMRPAVLQHGYSVSLPVFLERPSSDHESDALPITTTAHCNNWRRPFKFTSYVFKTRANPDDTRVNHYHPPTQKPAPPCCTLDGITTIMYQVHTELPKHASRQAPLPPQVWQPVLMSSSYICDTLRPLLSLLLSSLGFIWVSSAFLTAPFPLLTNTRSLSCDVHPYN
jgi:hypothetical protein